MTFWLPVAPGWWSYRGLERDGYIARGGDKTISFTPTGREHAEGIVRRHRLIERFLDR